MIHDYLGGALHCRLSARGRKASGTHYHDAAYAGCKDGSDNKSNEQLDERQALIIPF